jgi:hypothetical protein
LLSRQLLAASRRLVRCFAPSPKRFLAKPVNLVLAPLR